MCRWTCTTGNHGFSMAVVQVFTKKEQHQQLPKAGNYRQECDQVRGKTKETPLDTGSSMVMATEPIMTTFYQQKRTVHQHNDEEESPTF